MVQDIATQLFGVGPRRKPSHTTAPLDLQIAGELLFEPVPAVDAEHAEVEVGARALGERRVQPSEGLPRCPSGRMLGVDEGYAGSTLGEMVGQGCADDPSADDDDVFVAMRSQFRSVYS